MLESQVGSNPPIFVYDDSMAVSEEIHSLSGVRHYGELIFQRKRLEERALDAARHAGLATRVCVRDVGQRVAMADELAGVPPHRRYLYVSSDIAEVEPGALRSLLARLSYSERPLLATVRETELPSGVALLFPGLLRGLLLASDRRERRFLLTEEWDSFAPPMDAGAGLIGLADLGRFLRFMSGAFYTRAFNAIQVQGRTVVKRSGDREKIKREHAYWYHLPPRLQHYVVQPFDLEVTEDGASYRMERLLVPDMAVMWIHGALELAEFKQLLDGLFDWMSLAPRQSDSERAAALRLATYVQKVEARISRVLATSEGGRLGELLQPRGGLSGLLEQYRSLLAREWKRENGVEVSVIHGDLCFSNILFDKRTGMLKLLDPRGALEHHGTFGEPHYDVVKLSHSVLGGYDFVNNDLFDVVVDDGLGLRLERRLPEGIEPLQRLFVERVSAHGFDLRRVRLYEASLFLSMLPLHAEAPRKQLGFALCAAEILDELEQTSPSRRLLRWGRS